MPDVVVVGGGIIGAACARELSLAGASVTLIERAELAAGASGRNQGWLVHPDDPVNLPLFEPSLPMYLDVEAHSPLPVWIDPSPIEHIQVALEGDTERASGEPVDRATLLELEPALSPRAVQGWVTDGGRRVDPASLTVGLALLAAASGATVRHHLSVRALVAEGDRIGGVVTDEGVLRADEVVVAAGPWSAPLLDAIGVRLTVWPARGWIVRLAPDEPLVRHLVERVGWRETEWRINAAGRPDARTYADEPIRAAGGALVNPHPDGTLLVGSSREPAVGPEPADPDVARRQVAEAIELIPALERARVHSSWWGVRPMSPDDRPFVGRVRQGLIVATGHGSEGVILGGGTARLVASIVTGDRAPFDPSPFDPLRTF